MARVPGSARGEPRIGGTDDDRGRAVGAAPGRRARRPSRARGRGVRPRDRGAQPPAERGHRPNRPVRARRHRDDPRVPRHLSCATAGHEHCAIPPGTIVGQVLRTGRPAHVERYERVPGPVGDVLRTRGGAQRRQGGPVLVDGRVWGAMVVGFSTGEPPPAGAEQRVAEFAELVSTAISNVAAQAEGRAYSPPSNRRCGAWRRWWRDNIHQADLFATLARGARRAARGRCRGDPALRARRDRHCRRRMERRARGDPARRAAVADGRQPRLAGQAQWPSLSARTTTPTPRARLPRRCASRASARRWPARSRWRATPGA